jgi:hypothetical protein
LQNEIVDDELDNKAAIDGENLPMDVGGIRTSEETDGGGYFFAFAVTV